MAKILLSSAPGVRQYLLTSEHDRSKIGLQTEFDAEPTKGFASWLRDRVQTLSRSQKKFKGCKVLGVVPAAMYFDPGRKMYQWTEREWEAFWRENRSLVVERDFR